MSNFSIAAIKMLFTKIEHEAAVIVPIYKEVLNEHETIALDRCLKTFTNHKIIIIAPEDLSPRRIRCLDIENVSIEFFNREFFTSTGTYSRLLLSFEFYARFAQYRYILIYQLDAFVFSNQLTDWCKLSYDYIGAPWIDCEWVHEAVWAQYFNRPLLNKLGYLPGSKMRMVGNGGFSLRKVKSCMMALILLSRNADEWLRNEDTFWSFEVPRYLPFFRIPNADVAIKFAIETKPRECFAANNNILPFGCHAWEKHDIDFWRQILAQFNYSI